MRIFISENGELNEVCEPKKSRINYMKETLDRILSVGKNLDPWMHLKAPSEKTIEKAQSFILDLYQQAKEERCWVKPLFINADSEGDICIEFLQPIVRPHYKKITFYINEKSVTYITTMENGEILKTSDATNLLKWMTC